MKQNKNSKIKNRNKMIHIILAQNHAKAILFIFKPSKTTDFLIMWMFIISKEYAVICSN